MSESLGTCLLGSEDVKSQVVDAVPIVIRCGDAISSEVVSKLYDIQAEVSEDMVPDTPVCGYVASIVV